MLLTRLGMQPDEIVFVDDDEESLATAIALGIRAIQFRSTAQTIAAFDSALLEQRV
jgi:FMN phosphatase YigB (HAD superfamily)